jgi:hypothetical protein
MARRRDDPLPDVWVSKGNGYIMLGGVPYAVTIVDLDATRKRSGTRRGMKPQRLKPGYDLIRQTEVVEEDNYTPDLATCYSPCGARLGKLVGKHETDGLPLYEPVALIRPGGGLSEAFEE